ncbi:nucleoside-diphosphate-sugar epimerase [Roseibium hamelinense]|uniref:Nucleoside-diphosphate-sugar epimerase n=1 Tax=Roseibium hamelinense TaxID=150831 RepID=A0A562SFJ0_9HYPH|nr:NAD-dependent epimerase/dehydratase family protein [Roseibium hamelinense]MTI44188.1 NAD-dependent epimerase/dehydratase family protein [Roseibium hamelinense]TWI80028.1 nucleoside-diphosphate-sugar epimerase [Roseibium hamelinense]
MEVFVTGGTGTIGSAVIKRLVADGASVIGLTRSEQASDALRRKGASAYPGDLKVPEGWAERAAACDAVVHAGATFDAEMAQVDRRAMQALQKAAMLRQTKLRLVYTGGIWLFPAAGPQSPLLQTTAFSPVPAFKWAGEQVRSLLHAQNLNLSVIHPGLVCGPDAGPVFEMARSAASGETFRTRAQPETRWPLVHVDDLAGLYAKVLAHSSFRVAVIAAPVAGAPVHDIAGSVSAACGLEVIVETMPTPDDADPRVDWAAGYARSQVVNTNAAKRLSGWSAEHDTLQNLVGAICV